MLLNDKEVKLTGHHFLINIAVPENTSNGLFVLEKDPRKFKRKPDCYVGVVEEVGSDCFLVKPGDKIVFRRWEWEQYNVDDERLIAEETDLLVLASEVPAPGVIIVRTISDAPKTSLFVPQNIRQEKKPSIRGEVVAHSEYSLGELKGIDIKGKVIHFQRSDTNQWTYGNGLMAIKVCSYFEILAIEERVPELTVI